MALGFQSEEGTASSWRRVGRPRCASAQGARDTAPPTAVGPSVFCQGRLPVYVSSSVLLLW